MTPWQQVGLYLFTLTFGLAAGALLGIASAEALHLLGACT